MFRLEKLELNGFKSFADKTALMFGEGLTAVVGPNGCGKSNVADAISWVLGEQSAKSLRGGKMEDVIFNGTRDRKPTGMAEVLLTLVAIEDIAAHQPEEAGEEEDEREFDEALSSAQQAADAARELVEELAPPEQQPEPEAGVQPASVADQPQSASVDQPADSAQLLSSETEESTVREKPAKRRRPFQPRSRRQIAVAAGERIVVGRRLYRTGDSEYLLNGRACLLRDIQDLFAGTGLGGAHYAIIEQGRIGQILSSKPLDRRGLIEEAAGITKFKSRKHATELKLESARQNLLRLNDIITEVERQVNSLKRQAQKARRYRRLRDEMRSLLKIVFTADYHRLNESLGRIARELELAEREQHELDARLTERETLHRAAATAARAAEDNLTGLRERFAALELEADRARNRRAFEQQQVNELGSRVEEIERDQGQLDARLTLIQEAAEQRASAVHQLETGLNTAQAELRTSETTFQTHAAGVRDAETELEELRRQMLAEVGNTERLRNLRASLDESLKAIDQRRIGLESESERAANRLSEVTAEQSSLAIEISRDDARFTELTAAMSSRGDELSTARDEEMQLRDRYDEVNTERGAASQRLRSLKDLDEHRAYYSDAVQQVLSPEQSARINALGTLADFVQVDAQYERLVESLFSRELQCVLVPTIDDALTGVEYLRSEGLGRGAFLVVGLHGAEGDSFEEPDDRHRESPEEFETASQREDRHADLEGSPDEPRGERRIVFENLGQAPVDSAVPEFLLEPPRPATWPISDSVIAESVREPGMIERAPKFQLEVLRAIDLLGLRTEIKSVLERAFPDKCAAAVVPDIEAALQLSIENSSRIYVTMEGEQVVNGRLIVSGAQAGPQGTSLLALKREIKDLGIIVEQLSERTTLLGADCRAVAERVAAISSSASAIDNEHRELDKAATARKSRADSLVLELERAHQHSRVVQAELERAAEERAELQARMAQVAAELEAAEASRATVETQLASRQSELSDARSLLERLGEELAAAREQVATLTERLTAARAELKRLETEAEELRSRLNRNRLELYDSHGRIEQLTASLAEGDAAITRLDDDRAQLGQEINLASEGLSAARLQADELDAELAALREALTGVRDRRGHAEVERARVQTEAEHLTRDCLSELGLPIEDVVTSVELAAGPQSVEGESAVQSGSIAAEAAGATEAGDEEPGPAQTDEAFSVVEQTREVPAGERAVVLNADEARVRLEELRTKIDDIGPVNMMALEELEESETRFVFLSGQRSDILDSVRMTEEALAEIKRRSRERFRHAFTHINENFQRMFVELFGGGRGEMILIDEDDVLESGIDLIAQPPGKRLQNVLLLSGGEKAMAAIALVLAIFQYRPSPFCILDEVDAPLDEVNVGRFSDKVIEMGQDTQFLVITHNKRTMEAARALYGVTMEEPGVSKLVSVRFE